MRCDATAICLVSSISITDSIEFFAILPIVFRKNELLIANLLVRIIVNWSLASKRSMSGMSLDLGIISKSLLCIEWGTVDWRFLKFSSIPDSSYLARMEESTRWNDQINLDDSVAEILVHYLNWKMNLMLWWSETPLWLCAWHYVSSCLKVIIMIFHDKLVALLMSGKTLLVSLLLLCP